MSDINVIIKSRPTYFNPFVDFLSDDFTIFFKRSYGRLVTRDGFNNDSTSPNYGKYVDKDGNVFSSITLHLCNLDGPTFLASRPRIEFYKAGTNVSYPTLNNISIRKKDKDSGEISDVTNDQFTFRDAIEVSTILLSNFDSLNASDIFIDINGVVAKPNDGLPLSLDINLNMVKNYTYTMLEDSINSFEFTRGKSNNSTLCYGVQLNDGSISLFDKDDIIKEALELGRVDDGSTLGITLDDNNVGWFSITDISYDQTTKCVDFSMRDPISVTDNGDNIYTKVLSDGYNRVNTSDLTNPFILTTGELALKYLEELLFCASNIIIKYSDELLEYLKLITLPYYFFDGDNMYNIVDTFCKDFGLVGYISDEDCLTIERFDEVESNTYIVDKTIDSPKYDLVTRNRVSSISIDELSSTSPHEVNVETKIFYTYTLGSSTARHVDWYNPGGKEIVDIRKYTSKSSASGGVYTPFFYRTYSDVIVSSGRTFKTIETMPVYKPSWLTTTLEVDKIPIVSIDTFTVEIDDDIEVDSLSEPRWRAVLDHKITSSGLEYTISSGEATNSPDTLISPAQLFSVDSSTFNLVSFSSVNKNDYTSDVVIGEYNLSDMLIDCALYNKSFVFVNYPNTKHHNGKFLVEVKVIKRFATFGTVFNCTKQDDGTYFVSFTEEKNKEKITIFDSTLSLNLLKFNERQLSLFVGDGKNSIAYDMGFTAWDKVEYVIDRVPISSLFPTIYKDIVVKYNLILLNYMYDYYKDGLKKLKFKTFYTKFNDEQGLGTLNGKNGLLLSPRDMIRVNGIDKIFKITNTRVIYDGSIKVECECEHSTIFG